MGSLSERDGDRKLFAHKDLGDSSFGGESEAHSLPHHRNAPESDTDCGGIQEDSSPTNRSHDPTPVGVLSKEGSLHQI